MRKAQPQPIDGNITIAQIPSWVTNAMPETPEDVAFLSGAALAHLHLVARSGAIPEALWRARLALAAAEVCVGFAGRREGEAALRDAVHLTKAGDHPGPAGAMVLQWTRAVARPISAVHLGQVVSGPTEDEITGHLKGGQGMGGRENPVDRAAAALEAVLADAPRAETTALILADAVLAKALGWDHILPLLSRGLKSRDLRLRGADLRLACHRAVVSAAALAVAMAADLARRVDRLRAVAPKLRAKGADRAVALFLARDALAPSVLTTSVGGGLSDRAARRLCERLVELGAVRELTGRDSFRLYGV